ncbi:MAG: hypothetical protein KJ645_12485 [Planctomycetes bacterium]|nr:hypothetical protein [Planctomycetota bacterium]
MGGACLYNHLGVIEKYGEINPDFFIMAVYGGNDFSNMLPFLQYFHHLAMPNLSIEKTLKRQKAARDYRDLYAQEFDQVEVFKTQPLKRILALKAAKAITLEVAKQCRERGIRLMVVYIPGFYQSQPRFIEEEVKPICEILDIEPSDIRINDEIARHYLASIGTDVDSIIDMRKVYTESPAKYSGRVTRTSTPWVIS